MVIPAESPANFLSKALPMPAELPRFVPIRRHKAGGYGEVWLGTQTTLERQVALKVIKVDMVHRINAKNQAIALARLPPHDNIVQVIEFCPVIYGEDDEPRDTIVMEWLEGKTLEEHFTPLQEQRERLSHVSTLDDI